MLIFDIDGVITNPLTGAVEPDVLEEIAARLQHGDPVALNTGRGIALVMERIIAPLAERLANPAMLHHICIMHEKGALRTTFNEAGEQQAPVLASGIVVPSPALRADILALLADEFLQTMFPGDTKVAIISPEMRSGVDYAAFQRDQQRLVQRLASLLIQHGCAADFRIDPTRIATDVEDRHVGKGLGIQRILEWLEHQRLFPSSFTAFGDSVSDIAMAEELHRRALSANMVFVGEPELLAGRTFPFPLICTQARCEQGTAEYLRSMPRSADR